MLEERMVMLQALEQCCAERRSIFYAKTDLPLPPHVLTPEYDDKDHLEIQHLAEEVSANLFGQQLLSVAALSDQGTFHRLFAARLSDGRSAIVRVNALSAWRRGFAMHLDAWAMQHLRTAGLPALDIYEVETSRQRHAYDYQVMAEAPGVSLRTFDSEETRIGALLFELGQTTARLHQLEAQRFGLIDLRPLVLGGNNYAGVSGLFSTWREYVRLNLERHVRVCGAIGAIRASEGERILALFETAEGLLTDVNPTLLHGDLGNHNVFTDGTKITALIDWEDCLAGDPVFEIAFWATFHPERRHDAFLDGYRSVGELPDDFELRFWLYFLRIALSKTVLRNRFGLHDKPGRAPASLRIQRSLEKVSSLLGRACAA